MPKVVAEKVDWVKLGFELFARHGEAGIIVDKMVQVLKCNRSSFYWHFHSKTEFIKAIVAFWIDIDTEQIIVLTNKSGSPTEKFTSLIQAVFREDPQMDFVFHIKRYALKDKSVQKQIDEVDTRRINYTASLLEDLGYTQEDAVLKSSIFYKYLIGHHEMIRYKKQPKNYVDQVLKEIEQFIAH
ncbi:MAG: TetR/AcrR family transcriptional regulator [Bacteroidota bacterium]